MTTVRTRPADRTRSSRRSVITTLAGLAALATIAVLAIALVVTANGKHGSAVLAPRPSEVTVTAAAPAPVGAAVDCGPARTVHFC